MLATFKHNFFLKFAGFMMRFMGQPSYTLFAGKGSSAELCKYLARMGTKRLLVVTDRPLVELGIVDRATASLVDTGVEMFIYDGVLPDPTFNIVDQGAQAYRDSQCDAILAIGGGSSIDAAKIIGLAVTHEGSPREYVGMNKAKNPIPPLYVVPTTSGTGSEATRGAVISDSETHEKGIIAGGNLGPTAACLDPELLTGLPPHITAATGMDALTHAIEAYLSVWDRADAKEKARAAVKIIFSDLRNAYENGGDLDTRDAMAHAAYMAGQAINLVNVGNVHAIAHQLGGEYGIPHGLANAIVLPHVLEMSKEAGRESLSELAGFIGLSTPDEFIDAVRKLNAAVQIPETVEQLKTADIPAIVERAVAEGSGYSSPYFMQADDCEKILRNLLPQNT